MCVDYLGTTVGMRDDMWLVVWNFGVVGGAVRQPNKCLCLLISDKDLLKIQKASFKRSRYARVMEEGFAAGRGREEEDM